MAKRKNNDLKLILNFILLVLSAVTLISLFVGVIHATQSTIGTSELWAATGTDLISSAFAAEVNGLEAGARELFVLGAIEENAFVVGVFQWGYIVTLVAAAACFVFTLLDILHIRLTLFNKLCALVLALGSLVTIIFGFVTAGKIAFGTGSVMFGLFLLIAGIVYTVLYFVKERD